MKLCMTLGFDEGGIREVARKVVELEKAGLDMVWVPEAYSFDAISQVGYLAAVTDRIQIGTGIVNVYSRTPALMAMTAAGADFVSEGRFHLGLGTSGPQVIEGFHGIAYEKPLSRTVDYIKACRMIWRRVPFKYVGSTVEAPLPAERGTGLGKALKLINHPLRADIPIWWASLMGRSVEATAQYADGWIPMFFDPCRAADVWGAQLAAGRAKRDPSLGALQIATGGIVAIGDEFTGDGADIVLDGARASTALYVGGMGARGKNFYNTIAQKYGYVTEAATIQDLYLSGRKAEAEAAVPRSLLESIHLVGPRSLVAERIAAYREAGVTMLSVRPYGPNPARTVEAVRELIG